MLSFFIQCRVKIRENRSNKNQKIGIVKEIKLGLRYLKCIHFLFKILNKNIEIFK